MHLLATLLGGLTSYQAMDQFLPSLPAPAAAGPMAAAAAAAAVPMEAQGNSSAAAAIEPWLSSRFDELPPSVPAPAWHVASDEEV